jgi:hypothetical protein
MDSIVGTMPEEYAAAVIEDVAQTLNWATAFANPLTIWADGLIRRQQGPLAMPESVCRFLVEQPQYARFYSPFDCQRCGYAFPTRWTSCPMCGGRVGYHGWLDAPAAVP